MRKNTSEALSCLFEIRGKMFCDKTKLSIVVLSSTPKLRILKKGKQWSSVVIMWMKTISFVLAESSNQVISHLTAD